ncbi:DNA alkylation repair protein [Mycolicibacterium sp. P9-64]|uniref:DNA alkylation repair protein n=1 Tax=Mycolicibacterium sp. P9-64 TaxID=2024612 RepID=UPI0011EE3DF7|nr:DNA alkylation repair protein [Mycolicibacterium sp. P9-64]KAA0084477.1 DNA alkylation repair protein [Mycolicibacterium sp. P9-64]
MPTADELLNADAVLGLARILDAASPARTRWTTVPSAVDEFSSQTLTQRVAVVCAAILHDSPGYPELASIVRRALIDVNLTGWMIWPLTEAIAVAATAGGDAREFDDGMDLLAALTPRLTSEFAVRTFLNADFERALSITEIWSAHDDGAVRRLASEGTRPKLPWAKQVRSLIVTPGRTRRILDALYRDESETVRRSVANHLNDVSRLQPETAVATATGWAGAPDAQTPSVIRRAMRTLVKAGDPAALELLGFTADRLDVHGPVLEATAITLGGAIAFTGEITNLGDRPAVLAIDYVIHHRKANGSTTPKMFKLTTKTMAPQERIALSRRHAIKPITTRRYYPGVHGIELQVNGQRFGYAEFVLSIPS